MTLLEHSLINIFGKKIWEIETMVKISGFLRTSINQIPSIILYLLIFLLASSIEMGRSFPED